MVSTRRRTRSTGGDTGATASAAAAATSSEENSPSLDQAGGDSRSSVNNNKRGRPEDDNEAVSPAGSANAGAAEGEGATSAAADDEEVGPRPAKNAKVEPAGISTVADPRQLDDPEESDCGTPPPPPQEEGGGENPGARQEESMPQTTTDPTTTNPATINPHADTPANDMGNPTSLAPATEGNPSAAAPVAESEAPAADGAQSEDPLFMVDREGVSAVDAPTTNPLDAVGRYNSNPAQTGVGVPVPSALSHINPGNDPPPASSSHNAATTNPATTDPAPPAAAPAPAAAVTVAPTYSVPVPAPMDPSIQPSLVSPATSMVPPVTEVTVEETEQISSQLIGKVIGKGGESIRDLMARSGARMDVEQNVPPGLPRTLTYRGTRRSVDFAKMLVRMLTTEGVNESELPLGDATREILVIPAQSVGKIIGRAGDMVREIQSRSGARVQVEHSAPSSSAGMVPPDKKQVTITGLEPSVVKAKEMIMFLVSNPMVDALTSLNLLADDKLRGGGVWGSGPPYPNLPNQGYNMTPDMVAGGAAAYQQGMGAGAYGGAPFAGVGAYGGHQAYPGGAGAAYAAAPYAAPTGGGGAVEVDVTNVQRQYLGRIIGQRGVTINDLQRRSGCDIQVNQQQSMGSPDAEITIRGTRQGIEHVKHMIREIIEVGPAHPYAGGGDSARGGAHHGGGGGGGYGGYQQQQGYDYAQQAAYGAYQQPQMQQSYGQQQQSYGYQLPVAAQQPSYGQTATYSSGGQLNFGIPGPYGAGQQGGASYGTPAQPPVASLPPQQPPRSSSWKTATTPEGQVYYYNEQTGETQWDKPVGM